MDNGCDEIVEAPNASLQHRQRAEMREDIERDSISSGSFESNGFDAQVETATREDEESEDVRQLEIQHAVETGAESLSDREANSADDCLDFINGLFEKDKRNN